MPTTPNKMHMHDLVKIDTIIFLKLEGGGVKRHPGSLTVSNTPDQIELNVSLL